VKIIRSEDEEMFIHMQREFRILQTLNGHPNIIAGVEYIPEHAKCRGYMVMELVEGDNLWDLVLKNGFFPEAQARLIFKVIV